MVLTNDGLAERLAMLGEKIAQKSKELEAQGVLHGQAREKAVNLQIEHRRLLAQERSTRLGDNRATSAATLAADVEGLKLSFEKWFAEIDKHYEKGF